MRKKCRRVSHIEKKGKDSDSLRPFSSRRFMGVSTILSFYGKVGYYSRKWVRFTFDFDNSEIQNSLLCCRVFSAVESADSVPPSTLGQNSRNEKYIQTSVTGRSLHHLTKFVTRRLQEVISIPCSIGLVLTTHHMMSTTIILWIGKFGLWILPLSYLEG